MPLLNSALKAMKNGRRCAFATVVEATLKGTPRKAGAKMLVFEDGGIQGSIGGGRNEKAAIQECLKAIKSKKAYSVMYDYFGQKGQSICGGRMKVFIDPLVETKRLLICGGGHIALPLSVIAKTCGFEVTVFDNRKEFACHKRFAHVDHVKCGSYVRMLTKESIDGNAFVVIVTQGNEFDYKCLKAVLSRGAAYVGVISSKLKRIKFFRRLKEEGVADKFVRQVHIPCGMDIGGQLPAEIAVSIVAELLACINKDSLGTDKFKVK